MRSKYKLKTWMKVSLFIVAYLLPIMILLSINSKLNQIIDNGNSNYCVFING